MRCTPSVCLTDCPSNALPTLTAREYSSTCMLQRRISPDAVGLKAASGGGACRAGVCDADTRAGREDLPP